MESEGKLGIKKGEREERIEKGLVCTHRRGPGLKSVCTKISEAGRIYTANMKSKSDGATAAHPSGSCQC